MIAVRQLECKSGGSAARCQSMVCTNAGGAKHPGSVGFGPQKAFQNRPPLLRHAVSRARH
jgi:hypothetical protein